jgi:ring-1,2-phenylacetyl-CoA epoxidase subunit PaaB
MSDTQWPRYQVFLQDKPGAPYQDVGSVHAPDGELALFNARDVFVRRPQCFGLWVVRADKILSKTAEEIPAWLKEEPSETGKSSSLEPYFVFYKEKPAGTQTEIGQVQADSPENALRTAFEVYGKNVAPFVWWVFPARSITRSDLQDIESMFEPAKEKTFRMSTDFRTHSAMRKIKTGGKPG